MFKRLANRFMNRKKIIKLKGEVLKASRTLYWVDKKIEKDLTINFLISYIFESRTLSSGALKFVFITLIISLLLKINDVDSILNNIISDLIDFLMKFVLKLNIFK